METDLEYILVTKAKEFVRQHQPQWTHFLEQPCVIMLHASDGEITGIDGTSYGKVQSYDPKTRVYQVVTYPEPYWGVSFSPPAPPGFVRFGGGMVVHIDEATGEPTGAWLTQ
ncbi:MAG TPA: hypothetical protein VKX17_05335 [Planctomycetota bacterium]|nr:hypothetical protein [Planctomycetota bacterium]